MPKKKLTQEPLPAWKPKFAKEDPIWILRPHLWGGSAGDIQEVRDRKYYVAIYGSGGAVFHTEVEEKHLMERDPFE